MRERGEEEEEIYGRGRKSIWCWVELSWQEEPRDGGNLGNHIRLLLIYAFSQTGRE
jgi:hypothetical protein